MKIMFLILTMTLTQTLTQTLTLTQTMTLGSQPVAQSPVKSADHYESQIRLADSLYKNYLPQYNYDEVKKAVEFFDSCEQLTMSYELFFESDKRQKLKTNDQKLKAKKRNAQSPVDLNYLSARAHYYHAVGLTERDDIVAACEHYFKALEIMEEMMTKDKRLMANGQWPKSKERNARSSELTAQSPDYEKIRFLSLIYTRLGELFLSENYCDLAISKYKKALKYNLLLERKHSVAITYKCLGNSYQLYNMPDSALYYYNKSLEISSDLINRLDVEKSIAQILYYKGEKDSAYIMIKSNLDKIENYGAKDSYYVTLGDMFYMDMEYDSAVYYLELSLCITQYKHTVISTSKRLSSIYNILGNGEKVTYYDSITLSVLDKEHNKINDVTKLQDIYSHYSKNKHENEYDSMMMQLRNSNVKIMISIFIVSIILLALNHVIHNSKHKIKDKIYNKTISEKDLEIHRMNEDINKLKKENVNLNDELKNIKTDSSFITDMNIIEYYSCDICKRILTNIDRIEAEQLKINSISCLSAEDLALLELKANLHLDGYIQYILAKYPKLKKQDIHCICLSLLNINEPTMSALLGKSYNAVWTRMKKIRATMNINSNADLFHI